MDSDVVEFLKARLDEDEVAARKCAEMFPSPWEIADRGWRVRIYAAEIPTPDLSVDDEDAMTVRSPVAIEVEPDRHIEDPLWLSERVAHIARHDPARVLREVEAKRDLIELHHPHDHHGEFGDAEFCDECQWDHGSDEPRIDNQPVEGYGANPCKTLATLAAVYADHPDYDEAWG